jgi:hypothetical protein
VPEVLVTTDIYGNEKHTLEGVASRRITGVAQSSVLPLLAELARKEQEATLPGQGAGTMVPSDKTIFVGGVWGVDEHARCMIRRVAWFIW